MPSGWRTVCPAVGAGMFSVTMGPGTGLDILVIITSHDGPGTGLDIVVIITSHDGPGTGLDI